MCTITEVGAANDTQLVETALKSQKTESLSHLTKQISRRAQRACDVADVIVSTSCHPNYFDRVCVASKHLALSMIYAVHVHLQTSCVTLLTNVTFAVTTSYSEASQTLLDSPNDEKTVFQWRKAQQQVLLVISYFENKSQ